MASFMLTVPNSKLADFKAGILEIMPNNEVDSNGDPVYTDNQWLKEATRRQMRAIYNAGKQKIVSDAALPIQDPDIIDP